MIVKRVIKRIGKERMSANAFQELRDMLDNMYDARIPKTWKARSWESASLGFWFTELLERNQQLSTWLSTGRPVKFWMTGFFNPQGTHVKRVFETWFSCEIRNLTPSV